MSTTARFLLRAIHALCGAIQALLTNIGRRPTADYAHRDLGLHRVNVILADLAALTTRIHPTRVGPAAFARLRPRPQTPAPDLHASPARTPTTPARPPARPARPARPLSARRLALRLEALLQDLDRATAALTHPIPGRLARLAARIRTLAGCSALEPTQPGLPQPDSPQPARTWATLIAEDWDPFPPPPRL